MVKLFIPLQNKKVKSDFRGLWYNDNKKLFYDYHKVIDLPFSDFNYFDTIRKAYRQECIFYLKNRVAYVYYSKDKIIPLKNKRVVNSNKKALKKNVKKLLLIYKGLTIQTLNKNSYNLIVYF